MTDWFMIERAACQLDWRNGSGKRDYADASGLFICVHRRSSVVQLGSEYYEFEP